MSDAERSQGAHGATVQWDGRVPLCTTSACKFYDGKRYELVGHRPGRVCLPTIDADAEERAPAPSERIAAAAIRVDGEVWTLPPPARHHVLCHAWSVSHYRDGENAFLGEHDQGFVTSTGRFVGRKEAWTIAEREGQLIERAPTGPRGTLFSEDVW